MNVICITGNLTKDLEIRSTQSGIKVASGTIAVNRAFKRNGEKETDFIDFTAFDKKAEYLNQYARKGDRLEISGRLESRKYTDRNGNDRIAWEVIVENITSFNKREDSAPAKKEEPKNDLDQVDIVDDDLPF